MAGIERVLSLEAALRSRQRRLQRSANDYITIALATLDDRSAADMINRAIQLTAEAEDIGPERVLISPPTAA